MFVYEALMDGLSLATFRMKKVCALLWLVVWTDIGQQLKRLHMTQEELEAEEMGQLQSMPCRACMSWASYPCVQPRSRRRVATARAQRP